MANDNGGERLINRIISDAEAEAQSAVSEAVKQAASILDAGAKKAEKLIADAEKNGKIAEKAVFDRVRTNAELESRKLLLQKKRELLNEAFAKAKAKFCMLDDETLINFYCSIMKNECTGSEMLSPSEKHFVLIKEAADRVNRESGYNLRIGEGIAIDDGGFMILAGGYEKDCSIDSVFKMLKDAEQTSVAKILFE